jgi:hypothetical protein
MSKSPESPSLGFDRALFGYALAGGAVASSASAAVIYSGPQNLQFQSGNQAIDMNGGGNDFNIYRQSNGLYVQGLSQTDAQIAVGINPTDAAAISAGTSISGSDAYGTGFIGSPGNKTLVGYDGANGNAISGLFAPAGPGTNTAFVGVRLSNGADWNYGWIRITVPYNINAGQATIVDWAYESNVNSAILAGAGAPSGGGVPLPGAAALAALAAGASGVRGRRKRERAA